MVEKMNTLQVAKADQVMQSEKMLNCAMDDRSGVSHSFWSRTAVSYIGSLTTGTATPHLPDVVAVVNSNEVRG